MNKKNILNNFQNDANLTAIYPGRLSKNKNMNSMILKYINTTWDLFYLNLGDKAFDAHSMLESSTPFTGLFYVSMGLSGEIGELQEKLSLSEDTSIFTKDDIVGEIGDVFWYLSQVCMELDTPMSHLLDIIPEYSTTRKIVNDPNSIKSSLMLTLSIWSGRVNDITKKLLRDSKGHMPPKTKETILENCAKIYNALVAICAIIDAPFEYVLAKNTEKLFSRKERNTLTGSGDNR